MKLADYSKGKIYRINCKTDLTKFYVGSTVNTLIFRLSGHQSSANNTSSINRELMKYFNSTDWDCEIVLIENYSCNSKSELLQREEYYRQLLNPPLNMYKAIVLPEERATYTHNYNVEYRQNNLDDEKARFKKYYDNNKEKMQEKNKSEEAKEAKKKWAESNKERQKEIIKCDCGGEYSRSNKSQHKKSKNHINNTAQ